MFGHWDSPLIGDLIDAMKESNQTVDYVKNKIKMADLTTLRMNYFWVTSTPEL